MAPGRICIHVYLNTSIQTEFCQVLTEDGRRWTEMASGDQLRGFASLSQIRIPDDQFDALEAEVLKLLQGAAALRDLDVSGVEMAVEFQVKGEGDHDG